MKGTLKHTDKGWIVEYWYLRESAHTTHPNKAELPVLPADVKDAWTDGAYEVDFITSEAYAHIVSARLITIGRTSLVNYDFIFGSVQNELRQIEEQKKKNAQAFKRKSITPGLTFEVILGRYGGFYTKTGGIGGWRICIGWIAVTLYFYDIDNFLQNVACDVEELKKGNATLPALNGALELLREMHGQALYKLSPDDDRPTHLPHDLFDRVEAFLKENPA